MSSMLEQAILDANELREAALRGAESSILEKYSEEVRTAMETILEQDPEMEMGDMSPEDPMAAGEESEETVMVDIPAAHVADQGDEEIVMVDLDDIIAAAAAEDEEEGGLDREEIAQEVGIEIEDDTEETVPAAEEPPANRSDDDVEIDESELVDIFQEILRVDVDPASIAQEAEITYEEYQEEEEEVVTIAPAQTTGMEKGDIEALNKKLERFEELKTENIRYKKLLGQVKLTLEEVNLQNARLLYANRVLSNPSLNERQKNQVAEMISETQSVEEARTVFDTLQKTMQSAKKASPQSLSEAVTRRSSVILSGNRKDQNTTEKAPAYNRWATLAGLEEK